MRIPKSKAVYVLAFLIAITTSIGVTAKAAYKTITVQDNGQRKVIRGFTFGNLASFLKQHQVKLRQHDKVTPDITTAVQDGMTVVVESPKRVRIIDASRPNVVLTFARTVGQLMQQRHIRLGSLDKVDLSLNQPLGENMTIHINRIRKHVVETTQTIPFQTIRQRTDNLYIGQSHVLTYGVKGLRKTKTTSVFVNGRRVKQTVSHRTVQRPANEVVLIGTKPRPYVLSARGVGSMEVLRELAVVATAYVAGGTTADGRAAEPGVIAVDPQVFPIGTKVYIPGIGVAVASDTGGAIVGNRIDICVSSEAEARSFGVRTINVYVIR